jgi:hypothetical protein
MRGKRKTGRGERELQDWIARLLEALDEQHQANEAPSETWRAFNLSNVVRGRVEECKRAPGMPHLVGAQQAVEASVGKEILPPLASPFAIAQEHEIGRVAPRRSVLRRLG